MNRRPLCLALAYAWVALLCAHAQQAAAPTNTFALDSLREQFDAHTAGILAGGTQTWTTIRSGYLAGLAQLTAHYEENGPTASLLIVQNERSRFERSQSLSSANLVRDPAELRSLQAQFSSRMVTSRQATAQQLLAAQDRYLRELDALQKKCQMLRNEQGVGLVKEERARALGLSYLREAKAVLQRPNEATHAAAGAAGTNATTAASRSAPPVFQTPKGARFKHFAPGEEPLLPSNETKDLRLYHTSSASRFGFSFYGIEASVHATNEASEIETPVTFHVGADGRGGAPGFVPRIRVPGTDNYVENVTLTKRGTEGNTTYTARIKVAAKNRSIDPGCVLVIEYFARPPAGSRGEKPRVAVHHVPLPALEKGNAVVVDDPGIQLWKEEFSYQNLAGAQLGLEQKGGQEFLGLILSIFKPDGLLIFQACSPQVLSKQASPSMPKAEEQVGAR